MKPKVALRKLFLTVFSAAELRRFLRDHHEVIVDALPGDAAPSEELADAAVLALARNKLIDAHLFQQLEVERPRWAGEIRECGNLWVKIPHATSPSLHEAALGRFRIAIAAGHGTMHLIGFPHRGRKPAARLQNVCVPLRLCRGESVVPWTLTRLVRHLLAVAEPAAHVVVLSDPGSGKTTLCQYLTVLLAGGVQMPGIEIPDVVPLHVSLREYVRMDVSRSLLQFVSDRMHGIQVTIGVDALTQACEDGRAVLIVDGFDEVGDAVARTEHRDRLNAFAAVYPRVPVLVTSREVGYSDVPLPETGDGAFLQLRMAPLNEEEMGDFAQRWYAAIEPDPGVVERGVADLMASIRAAPTVQALAENRLLLTLIVLIHRADARLPGERATLFERCIQMFLETWPGARGKRFTAIPPVRQRRLLETLAAALLGRRSGPNYYNLTMARDSLASALVSYWRADDPGVSEPDARIAAWIDYLHEDSGLISEVGPGVYQFAHRTLQEYLSACWYKNAGPDPVDILVEHHGSTAYREIWLMLVGCLAADRSRCESLYARMSEHHGERSETWVFLLDCLGEEASFSPAAVHEILGRTVRIGVVETAPSAIEQMIGRLWRFSARHHSVVREWFARGIRVGPCDDLPMLVWAAAMAATRVEEVLEWLDARSDRARAAAALAPSVWPIEMQRAWDVRPELAALGRWAWSRIDMEGAVDMLSTRAMPSTLVCRVAITALQAASGEAIVGSVTLQLALDALAIVCAMQASPAWREVEAVVFEPGRLEIPTAIRPPLTCVHEGMLPRSEAVVTGRRWIHPIGGFSPALRDDGEVELGTITSRFEGVTLFNYLVLPDDPTPEDFWVDACKPYGMDCFGEPDEFGDYERYDSGNDYPLKEFERDAVLDLDPVFSATRIPVARIQICLPDSPQGPGPYRLRARLNALRDNHPAAGEGPSEVDAALVDVALELHTCHAAHVLIAARSFAGDPQLQVYAAVLRQQHVWLLQNWLAVERGTPDDATPVALALMLALGWTQCLTTAHWPGTPRWRALLAGRPPAHWWPRVHWHLCWAVAMPDDAGHRAAVGAALAEGSNDPEMGALARGLLVACSG